MQLAYSGNFGEVFNLANWQIGKFGKYPQSKIHRKATNLSVRFMGIMRVKHWSQICATQNFYRAICYYT